MSNPVSEYSDMLEYMISELPGCENSLILQQLSQAGRKFCIDTEAWVETPTAIDVVEDQTEYTIITGYDAAVQRILSVKYGSGVTKASTSGILPEDQYSLNDDYQLELDFDPAEDITDGLLLTIVLRPHIASNELPAWFMERYAEGIMAATYVKLMSMTNKPWTNGPSMAKFQRQYMRIRNQAYMERFISYKRGGTRVTMRPWI